MSIFTFATEKNRQILDITDVIMDTIQSSQIHEGICSLSVLHTTACLTTADLDPGTDLDLLETLNKLLPSIAYRHPHNPSHTPDHLISSLIGPSLTLPIQKKQLLLGTWQRVILVEMDGPRKRQLSVTLLSSIG